MNVPSVCRLSVLGSSSTKSAGAVRVPAEPAWYHIILTTYGAWLYGDPRGFRTRHHREHVEGDYRNPPPEGRYARLEQRSREALKQPPAVVPNALRPILGKALVERFHELSALVVCAAVGGQHVHLLAKMRRDRVRAWVGAAKKHAWFVLRERGWTGKLWGKRSKSVAILDRSHQLNVYRYILRHRNAGAWVWSIRGNTPSPRVATRGLSREAPRE